jgi:hypothetical protein
MFAWGPPRLASPFALEEKVAVLLLLLTAGFFALAMGAMAVGAIATGRALKGSCGGAGRR